MKRKNTARNALFTSIMSLLLCVSMLVGTTFAWFTDEVVTGMNTIAAGNLDIELLNDGNKVNESTKLFDDVTLWEPGVVVYENLQVANVGTLALKYQMTLNFGKENDLNGHKLSEVLKVAVIDKVADNATRVEVLEAAKAALANEQGAGTLSNFYMTDELEAGQTATEQTFVIFWEPNANEIDNLYNANNGQITSDGEPLHIEFGINLQATQLMHEEDSFGPDYDEFASILPKATVNNLGPTQVTATTSFPNGQDAKPYDLDVAFQFLPNETYEEAQSNGYRYWHADYVIKADKDVPKNSMALAGYYAAFCKDYNNDNWVLLSSDEMIRAGTEIRLVQMMGGGSITVNYEEICQLGNDNVGFKCGAVDLTGANAGTTITVGLRLYETTVDPALGTGNKNDETGKYEVVGTYSYTFPAVKAATAEELNEALKNGGEVAFAGDVTAPLANSAIYGTPVAIQQKNGGTINGNGNSLNIENPQYNGYAIETYGGTIKNLVIDSEVGRGIVISSPTEDIYIDNVLIDGPGYAINTTEHNAKKLVVTNSTVKGWISLAGLESIAFTKCTLGENTAKYWQNMGYGQDYDRLIRPYVTAVFTDCVCEQGFYFDLSALGAGCTVTLKNCTVNGTVLTADNYAGLVTIELPDGRTLADCVIFA